MAKKEHIKYNTDVQVYKGIPVRLIVYTEKHFAKLNAKRFVLNDTSQNVWIPNCYLEKDGTIKANVNIDFVFEQAYRQHKLTYAGIDINPLEWN